MVYPESQATYSALASFSLRSVRVCVRCWTSATRPSWGASLTRSCRTRAVLPSSLVCATFRGSEEARSCSSKAEIWEQSKVESTVQCCLIAGEGRILDFGASWPRMARCSLARRIIVNQSFSPRIPQYHIPTATLEKILMNNVYIFTHTFTYRETILDFSFSH